MTKKFLVTFAMSLALGFGQLQVGQVQTGGPLVTGGSTTPQTLTATGSVSAWGTSVTVNCSANCTLTLSTINTADVGKVIEFGVIHSGSTVATIAAAGGQTLNSGPFGTGVNFFDTG